MAAGAGLTAAADASITKTLVGTTSGAYTTPSTNGLYVTLHSTQFTAATKAGGTEWTTASDTAPYARVQLGTTPSFGWTIASYSSTNVSGFSTPGVLFSNTAQVTFTAVAGNNQTLFSVGFNDGAGPTGGNFNLFADLSASVAVNIGIQVIFAASTGIQFVTY